MEHALRAGRLELVLVINKDAFLIGGILECAREPGFRKLQPEERYMRMRHEVETAEMFPDNGLARCQLLDAGGANALRFATLDKA